MVCFLVAAACVLGGESTELRAAKEAAVEAGMVILEVRASQEIECQEVFEHGKKTLRSKADIAASRVITEKLGKLFPEHAILTQDESMSVGAWYEKEWIWIVNPLDGTAEFAQGGDQFGVQIGLVHQGEPVLGVNYFPVSGVCYWGIKGGGAWREQAGESVQVFTKPSEPIVLLKSSGLNAISDLFQKIVPAMVLDVPNSGGRVFSIMDEEFPFSLKGKPTLYVSLGASPKGTKKGSIWNYAATAVTAKESGTIMTDLRGQPLNFLEPSTLLPYGVVVTSDPILHAQVVEYFTDLFSDKEE